MQMRANVLTAAAELRREPNFVTNVLDNAKKRVYECCEASGERRRSEDWRESSTPNLHSDGLLRPSTRAGAEGRRRAEVISAVETPMSEKRNKFDRTGPL